MNEVREAVHRLIRDRLIPDDLRQHESGQLEIRWVKTMNFARSDLVKEKRLDPHGVRGVWRITQRGREYLQENS